MKVIAVIPARYQSTRLPGKPLADINGKPMIQWVYERSRKARGVDRWIVATDDSRIMDVVKGFGGEAMMTPSELASGTDRVAYVAERCPAEIFINIQGDEPMIHPVAIEKSLELVRSGRFQMGTAMAPLRDVEELHAPSVVKVIVNQAGRALYFSRLPIPYGFLDPKADLAERRASISFRHLGLYVYSKEVLLRICKLPRSPLEQAENLEQLRAVESGVDIGVAEVEDAFFGIDTPKDLEKVRQLLL